MAQSDVEAMDGSASTTTSDMNCSGSDDYERGRSPVAGVPLDLQGLFELPPIQVSPRNSLRPILPRTVFDSESVPVRSEETGHITMIHTIFDANGVNPRSLIEKELRCWYQGERHFAPQEGQITFEFIDGTKFHVVEFLRCLPYRYPDPQVPCTILMDKPLKDALEPFHKDSAMRGLTMEPLKVWDAQLGHRWSLEPGYPSEHRVVGLRFSGMNEMGWIEAYPRLVPSLEGLPREVKGPYGVVLLEADEAEK